MTPLNAPLRFTLPSRQGIPMRLARAKPDGSAMPPGIEYAQPQDRGLFGPYQAGCAEGRQCFDLSLQRRQKGQLVVLRLTPEPAWPHAGEPYYRATESAIVLDWDTGADILLSEQGVPPGGVSWPELLSGPTGWYARSKSEYDSVDVWTDVLDAFAGPFDFDLDFTLRLNDAQFAPFALHFGTMGSLAVGLEYLPGPPVRPLFFFDVSGNELWIEHPGSHFIYPELAPTDNVGCWRHYRLQYRRGGESDQFVLLADDTPYQPELYAGDWPRWHESMPRPALRMTIEQLNERVSPDIDSITLTRL